MTSWKTTTCGILGILAALITLVLVPLLDGKPETLPQFENFAAVVLPSIAALFARDNNKSSEDVGAK